jgi:hypothetical protein
MIVRSFSLSWSIFGYLLFLTTHNYCSLESVDINLSEQCLQGFFEDQTEIVPVAVLDVPYLICDALNENESLAFDQGKLTVTNETESTDHLFTFSRKTNIPLTDNDNFQVAPFQRNSALTFKDSDNCKIHIVGQSKGSYLIQIVLRHHVGEIPRFYLQRDPRNSSIIFDTLNQLIMYRKAFEKQLLTPKLNFSKSHEYR